MFKIINYYNTLNLNVHIFEIRHYKVKNEFKLSWQWFFLFLLGIRITL